MLIFRTQSEQFNYLVDVSPLATVIFTGEELTVAAANQQMLDIWGKEKDIIGTNILQVLPEIKDQPFIKLLKEVYSTGETYSADDVPATLRIDGKLTTSYFSIIYKALFDRDGSIVGVINTARDVTEAVLARKLAVEIKEQLEFALDSAEIGTWSFDVESRNVTLDKSSLALLGHVEGEEINYLTLQQFVYAADRRSVEAAVLRATIKEYGGECDFNFRIRNADSNTVWIKCKGKAYFNEQDAVYRLAGIIQNITKELRIQSDLKRMAAIVDSSEDFCNYTDMDGRILYINPSGRKLLGIGEEPLIDHGQFIYHDEDSIKKIKEEILPILLAKGSWSGNLVLVNQQTQAHIPIYKQFHLIKEDATNSAVCIAGIAKDLREELSVRQVLADKNNTLESVVTELEFLANSVPPVVWTSKPDGNLDFINQRWYDQTGRTEIETFGSSWIEAVHPDDVKMASTVWENSLKHGLPYEVEFRVITKENQYRWFLVRALPLKNEDGKILKWYGTNTDIQEQKELEKQKDDFLAIASHELKTPITSLKAYTQVVEAMFIRTGDERNAMLLKRMNNQIDRLTKLIDDLLNVTKISAGKLQLNLKKFNFKELVDEVTEEVQKITTKHTINKDIQFNGEVFSDRDRIYQVVVNLLTNAIKYSPNSSEIDLTVTATNDELKLSVTDYGIGINEAAKYKVFEQFYRVQGDTDHTFAGMGLGLYISADIIKRLDGKIWVESVQDQGSTFSFIIPLGK